MDVAGEEWVPESSWMGDGLRMDSYGVDQNTANLSPAMVEKYGLPNCNVSIGDTCLTALNDSGASFLELADLIEESNL